MSDDVRQILFAARRRLQGIPRGTIAKELGVTPSAVTHLLSQSRDFVELRYDLPGEVDLEVQLMESLGLRDAVVVETGGDDSENQAVGQAAARYFVEHVGDESSVAVSCGATLLEMVSALPKRRSVSLTVRQLSVEGCPELIHQAPGTLVGLLKAKSAPGTSAVGLHLPPLWMTRSCPGFRDALARSAEFEEIKATAQSADFLFIGVGTPLPTDGDAPHSFSELLAGVMDIRVYRRAVAALGLVGEINNQLYDGQGRDQTEKIAGVPANVVNVLSLEDIRCAASSSQHVVAVASGQHKVEAIKTASRSRIFNVLITSRETAELLVRSSPQPSYEGPRPMRPGTHTRTANWGG